MTVDGREHVPLLAAPRRRFGRAQWLTTGLIVVLAGLLAGWLGYALSVQPVEWCCANWGGPGVVAVTDGVNDPSTDILTQPAGEPAIVMTTLTNTGHVPVTLSSAWLNDRYTLRLTLFYKKLPRDEAVDPASDYRTSRPFPMTLHPGEFVSVWLRLVRPECHPGEIQEMTDLRLHESVLGVSHDAAIPLMTPIAFCYPVAALRHESR